MEPGVSLNGAMLVHLLSEYMILERIFVLEIWGLIFRGAYFRGGLRSVHTRELVPGTSPCDKSPVAVQMRELVEGTCSKTVSWGPCMCIHMRGLVAGTVRFGLWLVYFLKFGHRDLSYKQCTRGDKHIWGDKSLPSICVTSREDKVLSLRQDFLTKMGSSHKGTCCRDLSPTFIVWILRYVFVFLYRHQTYSWRWLWSRHHLHVNDSRLSSSQGAISSWILDCLSYQIEPVVHNHRVENTK